MSLQKHSAPGANAGFSYQFERALHWLSQASAGAIVGIETYDDVALQDTDGTLVLEQDKHSIREGATPFGDRSLDLWKTLSIWLDALDSAEVRAGSVRFLMVTNKLLPDCIAKRIGLAATEQDAEACINELIAATHDPPNAVAEYMQRVIRQDSRANLRVLILNCEVLDALASTSGEELRTQTISHLQIPEWCVPIADSIQDELRGWLHRVCLENWQTQKPAWIQRNHFINALHAILDRRKRERTRERSENLIPIADSQVGEARGSPFVRQIHLVSDDDNVADNAIREFIRCGIEKARLSAEGNITDEDWLAFEAALQARWEKIRGRVIRMPRGSTEEDVGFEILTDTTEEHRERLAGSDTEQVYLTSGTYHRMANLLNVGWHPRYEELMKKILGPL